MVRREVGPNVLMHHLWVKGGDGLRFLGKEVGLHVLEGMMDGRRFLKIIS